MPTLNVAGWWDQEDFYGPLRIYEALERHDTDAAELPRRRPLEPRRLEPADGRASGGDPVRQRDRQALPRAGPGPVVRVLPQGQGDARHARGPHLRERAPTRWRRWDAWPPKANTEVRRLYFGPEETLSFDRPASAADDAFDAYVSDPAHPVPYRHRPIQPTYFPGGSNGPTWLVEDQRFVDDRADVLSWETAPLDKDLTIAGEVVAHLFASTTGSDADWVVKLIDVYPEHYPENWDLAGYQLMVSNEVFRGRYRKSFETPRADRARRHPRLLLQPARARTTRF